MLQTKVKDNIEQMRDKRKQIFGLILAPDCYIGIFLLLALPVAIAIMEYTLVLSTQLGSILSTLEVWLVFLSCALLTFVLELTLFLLLFADPGLVDESENEVCNELSSMCPVCQIRVEEFDHHCGLLGACVGAGTMPYFVSFLFVSACLSVLCFVVGLMYFITILMEINFKSLLQADLWRALTTLIQTYTSPFAHAFDIVTIVLSTYALFFSSIMFVLYIHKCVSNRYSVQRRRKRNVANNYKVMFASLIKPSLSKRQRTSTTLCQQELVSLMASTPQCAP